MILYGQMLSPTNTVFAIRFTRSNPAYAQFTITKNIRSKYAYSEFNGG